MMKGRLKIILKSDLCAGSGYSYAGIIDSDICYDEYGIPFIPARRLKGCLRDSYETILYSEDNSDYSIKPEIIFGSSGSGIKDRNKGIILHNAYIENYEKFVEALEKTKGEYATPQEILDRFSHVVGQTRMEDGVADTTSLRFTRVINRYSPITEEETTEDKKAEKETVLYADILYDESYEKILENVARATRHIGLKRNRGLGNVSCEFEPGNEEKASSKEELVKVVDLNNGKSSIQYTVKNMAPLMLSSEDDAESEDYISGQQVLGMLADRYLSLKDKAAESDEFKELFLRGKETVYSNLYPCKAGKIYYPAPEYVNRLKKTKDFRCVLKRKQEELSKEVKEGNQPKRLKGQFLQIENNNVFVYEVKKDIIYHHSHKNVQQDSKEDFENNEGILYTGEAIRSGQYFSGEIIVKNKYADIIKELLLKDDFFFGKSKTAQYGHCKLVKYEADGSGIYGKKEFKADDYLVLTFLSDYMPSIDGASIYRDRLIDTIARQIEQVVGVNEIFEIEESEPEYTSILRTGLATGYSGIWNLRKQPIPVIKAGGCVVLRVKKDFEIESVKWIGEHNNEGFGNIRISKAVDFSTELGTPTNNSEDSSDNLEEDEKRLLLPILKPIILNHWADRKIYDIIESGKLSSITNSAAGRIKLMLTESKAYSDTPSEAFENFVNRIESIKSDGAREAGERLFQLIGEKDENEGKNKDKDKNDKWDLKMNKVNGEEDPDVEKLKKLGLSNCEVDEALNSKWYDYLMAIIVDRKYNGRE